MRPKILTNSTIVTAQLIEVNGKAGTKTVIWRPEREIKNRVSFAIVMPVKLFKPSQFLHLPNHIEQVFKLKVIGGSGQFDWDTSSPAVAVASYNRVHPKSVGTALLQVSDKMNEKNFDTIEVNLQYL